MKKLIEGIVEFRKNLTEDYRQLFAKLALGQKPDALFIACSDSRVVPNLFASTEPGDLFVLRNIGNLIPPASSALEENSAQAALEFSLFSLNIRDIIICGHSECGAVQAMIEGVDTQRCPHLAHWLSYGKESLAVLNLMKEQAENPRLILNPRLAEHNQISQINVLQQMQHLTTYPFIQECLAKKQLRIHGWWFDIAKADVYCYEPHLREFVLIEEAEGKVILERLR